MSGRTLVRGTLLLAGSGLALRGLGILFHTVLTRRIGAEGMGLMGLIWTVGAFAGTLGSSGVRVAALQLTARAYGKGDRAGIDGALRGCLRYGLLVSAAAGAGLILLASGGLSYTLGCIFYVMDRTPYMHTIWHVFVLGGIACQWVSVLCYVIPRP